MHYARGWQTSALALGLMASYPIGSVGAQEEPLSVTYGSQASAAEGDFDYREVIYFKVPARLTDRLYLRVFDADVGGEHDLIHGTGDDTETRFTLFGGVGASAAPAPGDQAGADELRAGDVIVERLLGPSAVLDDRWHTLASFRPDQGELIGDHYLFRLLVEGVSGNDGNLFSPTLSLRERRNLTPAGLDTFAFSPTVRVPDGQRITEMRFRVPAGTERVVVRNFDAANGQVSFASTYRSLPLTASAQNEWQEDEILLQPEERGAVAAILLGGGEEIPNDITVAVIDGAGRALPIELPVRASLPNTRPIPAADVALLASCFTVAFDASGSRDLDGDQLTSVWTFGDGGTGTGRAVVHRYPGPGSYRAVLRVVDSSGQVASGAVETHDVVVKRPPSANAGPDLVAAPGVAVDFDGASSEPGDRPIARYFWDFQDGGTAEGPAPTHVFETPGRYRVTLTVEDDSFGPCNFNVDQRLVQVNAAPVAEAGSKQRISVGEVVTFDGRRSYDVDGEVVGYDWDLGDDTRASGPVAEHAYAEPGTYAVTLTVRDDSGVANQFGSDTTHVAVNAPPIAAAGPDGRVAIGEVINFGASASTDPDGRIVAYQWDFGDGSQGSGSQVPYAYRRSGIYRVTLTVRDDSGADNSTTSDQLTVTVNEPPVAHAGDDQLVTSSEVQFDGTRSSDLDGVIARYEWDFGDGTQSTGQTPRHVYQKPGRYLIRLTVTDDSGTMRSSASDIAMVTVNEAPIADAGPDLIAAPGQKLTLAASGSIDPDGDLTEFNWDFKDGNVAAGERVEHSFDQPGVYRVRLAVRDDTGQLDAIDFDEAKVIVNAPPVAKAGPHLLAAPGDALQFDGTHSFDLDGSIVSYRWDFSDQDEPQFGPRVARAYAAPGIYTARLTVIDDSGAINSTAQDEVVIRINDAPVAEAGSDIFTFSTTVSFDGSQSADANGDALTYRWDFGDGSAPESGVRVTHTYAEGGSYPVVLTVDDGTGLRNATNITSITVVIDRPPVADAGGNKDVCAGDIVVFDGTGSIDPESGQLRYQWDFGDDTGSDIVNPTKVYERGAVYPVTLTVEDESGFATNRHTDRIAVRVDESPIAMAGPDQTVCVGTEVHFDGSDSRDFDGVVNRFSWNFGDGTVGGGERPVHVYDQPDDYRVLLTIEGEQAGQCDNTNSDETIVKAVEAPVARIAAPASAPVGVPVTFDASGSSSGPGRIVAWQWGFGDGGTATGPVVERTFDKAGPYFVTLAIRAEGGSASCSDVTAQHAILINQAPIADAGDAQLIGVGQEVLFDASRSHDPDGELVAYQWDFGDGAMVSGVNVWHRFRTAGRFPVTLVVTDDTDLPNNSAASTILVEVNHAPVPVIDAPPVACPGEDLKFSAAGSSDADGTIAGYTWTFGDPDTAEGVESEHSYQAPGFYDLGLEVDDGRGLNNSRQQTTQRFHVNRPPRAEAGPDRMACPGQPITFDASTSSDWDGKLESYRWDFGDGTSAEGVAVEHVFDEPGVYGVRLRVTDDSGSACAAASDVVRVVVNGPPVAEAGGDQKGFVGGAHDQLLFDASSSRDDDGQPLSFLWDFGDGVTVAGEKVLHAYDEPGVYPVRLSVSDGSGLACGQAADGATVAVQQRK